MIKFPVAVSLVASVLLCAMMAVPSTATEAYYYPFVPLWTKNISTDLAAAAGYKTTITPDGATYVVFAWTADGSATAWAWDVATGAALWTHFVPIESWGDTPTLVATNGAVLFQSTDGDAGTVTLTVFDPRTGIQLWSSDSLSLVSSLVAGDIVAANDNYVIVGINATTGQQVWNTGIDADCSSASLGPKATARDGAETLIATSGRYHHGQPSYDFDLISLRTGAVLYRSSTHIEYSTVALVPAGMASDGCVVLHGQDVLIVDWVTGAVTSTIPCNATNGLGLGTSAVVRNGRLIYTDGSSFIASAALTASGLVDGKVAALSTAQGDYYQLAGWVGTESILVLATARETTNVYNVSVFRVYDAARLWTGEPASLDESMAMYLASPVGAGVVAVGGTSASSSPVTTLWSASLGAKLWAGASRLDLPSVAASGGSAEMPACYVAISANFSSLSAFYVVAV